MRLVGAWALALVGAASEMSSGSDTCRETHVMLHNGVEMPRVGFGLAGMRGADTKASVRAHLAAGFRMMDGAEATEWYDDDAAADELARTRGVVREDVFIVTKVHPKNLGEEKTRNAVMRMLKRWNETAYIDAVLLHYLGCNPGIRDCKGRSGGDWQGAWRALEALYEQGAVRAIGVSNLHGADAFESFYAHARIKPHIVQNWMDPFAQGRDDYERARAHGAAYMAYSSLGEQHVHQAGANPVFASPTLTALAERAGMPIPLVVLAWQLGLPGVVVIPRSTNPKHIAENARLLDPLVVAGVLDAHGARQVDALDGVQFDTAETCDEVKHAGKCKDRRAAKGCSATCAGAVW